MVKMNNFKRCLVLQSCNINNPFSTLLEYDCVIHIVDPEIDFCEILLDLEADSIKVGEGLRIG